MYTSSKIKVKGDDSSGLGKAATSDSDKFIYLNHHVLALEVSFQNE